MPVVDSNSAIGNGFFRALKTCDILTPNLRHLPDRKPADCIGGNIDKDDILAGFYDDTALTKLATFQTVFSTEIALGLNH